MTIYRTTEKFVGREQEIKIFTEWLTDACGPWLLFFHDALEDGERKGGIGKTMLLKQCIKLLREQDKYIIVDMIDFFNIADRSGITIAERVIQALQKRFPDWGGQSEQTLNEYKEYLSRYHLMASSGNGNMQDVPSRLQTIREQLTDALSNELQQLHQRMVEMDIYVLLFFDTFELIEHNPITTVLRSSHTFPDNYHFDRIRAIIAGRNEPDWSHSPNWIGRQDEVHTVALSPFSKEEVAEYLRNHGLSDTEITSQALDVILENTEGRPILVGLVADVVINKTILSDALIAIPKSQFKERLADQINDLDGPVAWAVLFMAHVYHRFNEKLLTMIMDETGLRNNVPAMNYDELRVRLPLLSFVRRAGSGSDYVLHDEMRRLVNMYCWNKRDPVRTFRHDLSQLAITYYKEQIEKTHDEEIRQSYIVEMLYHELFKDGKHIEKGFDFFKQHFDEAVGLSLKPFSRSLLQEAQKFEKLMTSAQHRDLKLAEARDLTGGRKPGSRSSYL